MISSPLNESGINDFLKTGRKGPILAMPAMLCSPATAVVPTEKERAAVSTRKGGGRGKGKGGGRGRQGRCGNGTNEEGGCSVAAASGDGRSAKAADGGTSEVS